MHISDLGLTFPFLKQLILDQTKQNRYQTVPFSVYIHNLMFEISSWSECSEKSLGTVVILSLIATHRRLMTNVFIPETANT